MKRMGRHQAAANLVLALALASAPARAEPPRVVNPGTPPPDCAFHVNYDRNADLPGYRSGALCIPFMPLNQLIPEGQGPEFYVAGFSDAAIRSRWPACKADPACRAAALAGAKPFIAYEPRLTGRVDSGTPVNPEGDLDLRAVRRPGYFAAPAYDEPVARAEGHTYTVEFTVPRDSYERLHLHKEGTIKLRGWYLEGAGVTDGAGPRRRALVIMNNGGGGELTALDDPRSVAVQSDAAGRYALNRQPDALSEQFGIRHWRGFAWALNEAGFDVLVTDRRGNGVSGGVAGFNTAEQARDMFRELDAMESGDGLRLLAPSGEVLAGKAAAGRLMAGLRAAEMPVVLAGYSRGSYAVAWAMHQNFVEDCDRDLPDGGCRPALGRPNIKGAILYGPNSGGLGTRAAGHDMVEAALREEYSTTYYVDSDVSAHIGDWPALLIAKGTWDYVEGLEGSLEAYRRAQEPKEIFVFRGPHGLATQSTENMRQVGARMAAFATAAVLGRPTVPGARAPTDLRDLVTSSPDYWERTTDPAGGSPQR